MKKSIFTIAFLVASGFAFAQEPATTSKHAINTKGTGLNNGRSTSLSSDNKIVKEIEYAKSSSVSNEQTIESQEKKKGYVGHVTLIKREAKPSNSVETSESNEKNAEPKKNNKTGEVKFGWDVRTTETR